MAGYTKLYVIGDPGGFLGSDGVNPIYLLILVGESDRQWLEPHYLDTSIAPLGDLRVIVPAGPDHPDSVLDACIGFFPGPFTACGSFHDVASQLVGVERLDFHLGARSVPTSWTTLREEARPIFDELHIWRAELEPHSLGRQAD